MFRWPNACKELNSARVFIDIRLTWLEGWYQMPGEKGVTCCRTSSITGAWCRSTTGTIRGRSRHRSTWILSLPLPSNGALSQESGEPVGSATNVELVAAPHLSQPQWPPGLFTLLLYFSIYALNPATIHEPRPRGLFTPRRPPDRWAYICRNIRKMLEKKWHPFKANDGIHNICIYILCMYVYTIIVILR